MATRDETSVSYSLYSELRALSQQWLENHFDGISKLVEKDGK